jgi:hypothetical protein
MKFQEIFFISFNMDRGENSTLFLINYIDDFYTDLVSKSYRNDIHILFLFQLESTLAYLDVEYSTLNRDFTEYINLSVYGVPLAESNIFAELNKSWYAQAYAKDLDIFVDKLKILSPTKNFSYTVLPHHWEPRFPKYEFIMNLDCEYFPIYCPVGVGKCNNLDAYKLDLDKFKNLSISTLKSKIVIIFVYGGYHDYWLQMTNVETMGNFDKFRKHLADYINHRINDIPLQVWNYLDKINEFWYKQPTDNVDRNSIKPGRELIDNCVFELKEKYPSKEIKYVVLPCTALYYPYIII